ncbi:ras-related protein Rab-36 isoform X6 [Vulpes lagopus]|uniref:ras-related protein Rab-36 isoform X6 n=1 Tax=Vulpes lagopus TaxID=494514 RepID=UPI001BC94CCE|nr:ras-related protein Rab-36 isoform X6 [Vulpes lagopus]
MVIAATGPARPGRAAPGAFATPAGHPGRMRSSLTSLGPPVSRDRIITSFPKWYTPDACLQLKEHFHGQVSTTCQRRNTGTVGLRLSKVVVVGDLYVGKTSLIHRFCKNVFDRDYKATIGVDFEIERFEIAGIPYSLQIWDTAGQEKFKCIASAYYRGAQVIITAFDLTDVQTLEHTRQWLEDALRENEPGSCFVFLVGTKKDLLGLHVSRQRWRLCAWPTRCRPSTGRCQRRQERAWRTRNSACLPLRTFVVASLTLWRTSEALRSLASSSSTPLHPAHPGQAGTTQACPP